jgi:hypothetical protein
MYRNENVAVADLQRGAHRLGGLVGIDLEDTEPELRDRVPVVEIDRWNGAHVPTPSADVEGGSLTLARLMKQRHASLSA